MGVMIIVLRHRDFLIAWISLIVRSTLRVKLGLPGLWESPSFPEGPVIVTVRKIRAQQVYVVWFLGPSSILAR